MTIINKQTGAPYDSGFFIPNYPQNSLGKWRYGLTSEETHVSYDGSVWECNDCPALFNDETRERWMAILPAEIDAQRIAIEQAHGNVVVAGLGMGFATINMALKSGVNRVTVVEIDPDVIELFNTACIPSINRRAANKIRILNANALEFELWGSIIDFLYIDIKLNIAETDSPEQAFKINEQVGGAEHMYFWGQEIFLRRRPTLADKLPLHIERYGPEYQELIKVAGRAWGYE